MLSYCIYKCYFCKKKKNTKKLFDTNPIAVLKTGFQYSQRSITTNSNKLQSCSRFLGSLAFLSDELIASHFVHLAAL
jgi:hypothetical protein